MRTSGSGRPSIGSMMPSERPSALLCDDYVCRVKKRLRCSGAITSSRSALSHADAALGLDDDYVVDVGEGKRPNFTEQLMARLEQHGLRRCNANEDDFSEFTASPEVIHEETQAECVTEPTYTNQNMAPLGHEDARSPYYYICVPCEMRLTKVSSHASTHKMLEDAHFHFSSAAHRNTASWMADPDIDVTLTNFPLIDVSGYTRIFVNGVPMLLSRRPGGGDMFYALPHEQERFNPHNKVVRRAPPPYHTLDSNSETKEAAEMSHTAGLYPSLRYSSNTNYWYQPLTSLYNRRTRQIVSRFEGSIDQGVQKKKPPLCQSVARRRIEVHHVPIQSYTSIPYVNSSVIPTIPALYPILRRRIAKNFTVTAADLPPQTQSPVEGYRVQYIQPYRPYLGGSDIGQGAHALKSDIASSDRFIVEAEGVYRIGLLSENDLNHVAHEYDLLDAKAFDPSSVSFSVGEQQTEFVATAPLTQEMLSQLTQSMPFASKRPKVNQGSSAFSHSSSSFLQSSTPPSSGSEKSFTSKSSQN